jgi:4-methyl-5(b-hydroxyethyl)-thiazole monophosphate biosynthesis
MEFMKRVLTILHPGVEEVELLYPVDLLRRAGVEVVIASTGQLSPVTGRNGISIVPDRMLQQNDPADFDLLFLPGGPAVQELVRNEDILSLIGQFYQQNRLIAAICAAPLLLHRSGVLNGEAFSCHHSIREQMPANYVHQDVVVGSRFITSQGLGTSMQFGLALVEYLCGKKNAQEIATSIHATV